MAADLRRGQPSKKEETASSVQNGVFRKPAEAAQSHCQTWWWRFVVWACFLAQNLKKLPSLTQSDLCCRLESFFRDQCEKDCPTAGHVTEQQIDGEMAEKGNVRGDAMDQRPDLQASVSRLNVKLQNNKPADFWNCGLWMDETIMEILESETSSPHLKKHHIIC